MVLQRHFLSLKNSSKLNTTKDVIQFIMATYKKVQVYAYLQPWIMEMPVNSTQSPFTSQRVSYASRSSLNGVSNIKLSFPRILGKCLKRMMKLSNMEVRLETVIDLSDLVGYYLNSMNVTTVTPDSTTIDSDLNTTSNNDSKSEIGPGGVNSKAHKDSRLDLENKLKSLWDKVSLKLVSLKSIDDVEDLELGFLEILIGCSINCMIVDLVDESELPDSNEEDSMVQDNTTIALLAGHLDDLLSCETSTDMNEMHMLSEFNEKGREGFKSKIKVDILTQLNVSILHDNSNKSNSKLLSIETIIEDLKQKQQNEEEEQEEDMFCSLIKITNLDDSPNSSTNLLIDKTQSNPLSVMTIESLSLIQVTHLPDLKLFKSYGDLFYSSGTKTNLLRQVSDGSGKLVLLYGPPGSGKTTLCKAISNLLTCTEIGMLIELSCAQIFSMYLNQSDKNLDQLFNDLSKMLIQYPSLKVILLIDEIETLARSRQYLMSSTSANSTIQLVNTMLICLDKVKKFDNLTVFTTSNLIESLDMAFVDRVDFVMKIDAPDSSCIYSIIMNNSIKLIDSGSVFVSNCGFNEVKFESFDWCSNNSEFPNESPSLLCYKLSLVFRKLKVSGRFLDKACFSCIYGKSKPSFSVYLCSLLKMVLDKAQVAH